jgi:hypothetical protein
VYRKDFDANQAPVYELVQEVLRLRADLAIVAASTVQAAIEREWCNEYEQWARITNKMLSRPHLIERHDLLDDPTLDESGRWSATLQQPAAPAVHPYPTHYRDPQSGAPWCAACGFHHH